MNNKEMSKIDVKRVIDHFAKKDTTEFEKKRNERETEILFQRVEEIRNETYYTWKNKKN